MFCKRCGALKILIKSGASRCKNCSKAWNREYYRRSEIRRAKSRRQYLLRRYGVTLEHLEELLLQQQGCCAICGRHWTACTPACKSRYETMFLNYLCVDHDHESGRVRSLLCNACNTAIGLLEEDLARFEAAADYVRRAQQRRAGTS